MGVTLTKTQVSRCHLQHGLDLQAISSARTCGQAESCLMPWNGLKPMAPDTFISTVYWGSGGQVPTCREHAPVPEPHILIISSNSHLIGIGLQVRGHHSQLTYSTALQSPRLPQH